MKGIKTIETEILNCWLKEGRKITILDLRPITKRDEWQITNSIRTESLSKFPPTKPNYSTIKQLGILLISSMLTLKLVPIAVR